MDAEAKERLVQEFRNCLEQWQPEDDTADAPEPDAPPVNLALLFTELAVLRNEVRVQARQFKAALDDMRVLTELLGEQNRRLGQDLDRNREAQADALRQAQTRLLLDLLDVRDRMATAVAAAKAYTPGFWARLATKEVQLVHSLGAGITLTLGRIDDLLAERRVRALAAVGGKLDPHTMHAVGVAWQAKRPPGEVLSEVRRGYLRDGELLRLAEVIVNKQESEK